MINEFIIGQLKNEKVELRDVKLVNNAYGYCLNLTYRVEDDTEIRDFNIPCLKLPISTRCFKIRNEWDKYYSDYQADIGFGPMEMLSEGGREAGSRYTITVVETKTKEMTLAEIEKKLGHKVKIVNKKPTHTKTEDYWEDLKP